jgi:hypothetical protein
MNPTEYSSPSAHLKKETDPVSETLCCFLDFRMPEGGQSPKPSDFELNKNLSMKLLSSMP